MNSSSAASSRETDILSDFSVWYSVWHGYLSLVICALGIPLNVINIIVLTRRNMLTPINFILTCLAISDMATMISYVPFAYHFYCHHTAYMISSDKNSFGWMNFLLVYLNFSATTHTISIWIAVALAMLRYHHTHSPAHGSLTNMRRLVRARVIVFIIISFSIAIMIPNFLSNNLEKIKLRNNSTAYVFEEWNLGSKNVKPVKMVALLLYSILAKLVPCVMIIIYGGLLLRTLHKTTQYQRQLATTRTCLNTHRNNDSTRTTTMLLIVIVLFLLTELPQGILIMCSIFVKKFFEDFYIPLGDVMDILALLNNGINFVLYCTMSREFRKTFIKIFCGLVIKRNTSFAYAPTLTSNKQSQNSRV